MRVTILLKNSWNSALKRFVMQLAVPVLSLALASCVEPVRYSAKNEAFLRQHSGMQPWKKVVVLPFTGNPAFARTSAEWLAYQIGNHRLFEITGPAVAEIEMGRQGLRFGEGEIDRETAREAGRIFGADGVIVGSLTTSAAGQVQAAGWEKKVAAVSVVDVSTGQVVATSVHEGLDSTAVTEEVANDFLPVLVALAGRTWTTPPSREEPVQKMPWSGS